MVRDIGTDELDLQLLHVVQIAPRISWTQAGEILGLGSGAVAGRWNRMHAAGLAWTVVQPNPVAASHLSAFVDISCDPAHRTRIVHDLCADPRVLSLEECAQGRDLLATVMVTGQGPLSEFLLDDLARMDGVTQANCRIITDLHSSGLQWRLGALDAYQQRAALESATPAPRAAAEPMTAEDRALVAALSPDPRMPVAELARVTGLNPATARRHLQQVVASGLLGFRCDMAPQFAGWPVAYSVLARVAPSDRARVIATLAEIPQVRMCMSLTGTANLVVTMYSRTVSGLAQLEIVLGSVAPTLQLVDSILHLRTHKRMGWLLGPEGRCTGEVVVADIYRQEGPLTTS